MKFLRKVLKAAFPDGAWDVDLHGMRVPEALDTVARAVEACRKVGGGKIRIICGKGKNNPGGVGVLRTAVAGWLETHAPEARFLRNVDSDGLDGSLLVEVKPIDGSGGEDRAEHAF